MSQAKTLTEKELKKVLIYISLHKHAARNRAMFLLTHWSGMRVGEVAALRIGDVVAAETARPVAGHDLVAVDVDGGPVAGAEVQAWQAVDLLAPARWILPATSGTARRRGPRRTRWSRSAVLRGRCGRRSRS